MGQRHQIFIRVNNPLHTENYISEEDKKKARKLFGRNKTTIIALHHQWLYGASAVVMVRNILNATRDTKENPNRVFGKDIYLTRGIDSWVEDAMSLLQTITNPKFPRGIGIEHMLFLNEHDPEILRDCTGGDNNDGITIIDAIKQKYCMMNIFDYDLDEDEKEGIYSLPFMEPVSGREYVGAYYPDEEHKEHVDNISSEVEEYELLSVNELARMFPNNFKKDLEVKK